MPRIKLTFLSILAKIAGKPKMELEVGPGYTISTLFKDLNDRLNAEFREKVLSQEDGINPFVLVLVNGVDSRNNGGINTILKDGDQIDFLPAIAGG